MDNNPDFVPTTDSISGSDSPRSCLTLTCVFAELLKELKDCLLACDVFDREGGGAERHLLIKESQNCHSAVGYVGKLR
jgi:hypothetical protein